VGAGHLSLPIGLQVAYSPYNMENAMNDLGIYTIAFLLVVIACCAGLLSDRLWLWFEQRRKRRKVRAIINQSRSISTAGALRSLRNRGRRPQ